MKSIFLLLLAFFAFPGSDLRALPSGLYLLEILAEQAHFRQKFLKN